MMNQQQWSQLPLFLHTLEEKGFVLLAERYDLVLQIAQHSPDLENLKLRMGALLSSSHKQQLQFTEWFEQFFNPKPPDYQKIDAKMIRESLLQMLNQELEKPIETSAKVQNKTSTNIALIFIFIFGLLGLWLLKTSLNFLTDFTFFSVSFLSSIVVIAFLWLNGTIKRPFTLRREAIAPPSSFFDILIPAYAEVRFGRAFQGIARRLRQRLPTDQPILNVPATIRKSIAQGGFFTPQHLYRSKAPAYLLLIDQSTLANHRFQLAELLHNWLLKQDIEVERFWYRNDPRTCWNEAHPSGIPLEQLPKHYAESQLLLFGDGWQLLNPASQKLQPWARAFAQWENRTLVTPIAPPAWTRKETQLAQLFMLAPASVEGLRYWSESMLPQTEQNSPKVPIWHEKAVFITKENFLTALHQHFPNERLREWLCALACFPVLNWELTLRIGAVLSQKHGTYLLDYANLRRLTRISWFYNGYIPEEMRKLLYQQLDPDIAKLIHQCIVQILGEQIEDGRQHFNLSQRELALQIAVQQVAAGIVQAKNLVKYVWNNNSNTGHQDFLVLKHFYSKPYNIKVPDGLVKLIRPNQKYLPNLIDSFSKQYSIALQEYRKANELARKYFYKRKSSPSTNISKNTTSEIHKENLNSIERIKTLVANGELRSAIQLLLDISERKYQNQAMMLMARFSDLERRNIEGIIGLNDYHLELNHISIQVLELCDQTQQNRLRPPFFSLFGFFARKSAQKIDLAPDIKQIISLVANNKLRSAIQLLLDMPEREYQNQAIMLMARLERLERQKTDVINPQNYHFELNRISNQVLVLCDQTQQNRLRSSFFSLFDFFTRKSALKTDLISDIEQIRTLVANNKLRSAIRLLSDMPEQRYQDQAMMLMARFTNLERHNIEGAIGSNDYHLELNRISIQVLNLCDQTQQNRLRPSSFYLFDFLTRKPSQKPDLIADKVMNYVRVGDLNSAIQLLIDTPELADQSQARALIARLNKLDGQRIEGIINFEDYNLQLDRISNQVMELCNRMK